MPDEATIGWLFHPITLAQVPQVFHLEATEESARTTLDRAVAGLTLERESRILLAVSGGADSVAMLRAFARVAPSYAWQLRIAHVNHGLRVEQSDEDERFVQTLAASLDLEYRAVLVSTLRHADAKHLSLETAAREVRYEALRKLLKTWPGDVLAVAHTMDDQAETLLLHLLRGAGIAGLAGMRNVRGVIVRPFLGVSRETIVSALQEDRQGYRVDASNMDERHARARIRRTIIPALTTIQPQPVAVLSRSARLVQDDADLLARDTEDLIRTLRIEQTPDGVLVPRAPVAALHPSLRRALIRRLVEQVRGSILDVSARHIESIDTIICSSVHDHPIRSELPGRISVNAQAEYVAIFTGSRVPLKGLATLTVSVPGVTLLPTGILQSEIVVPANEEELHRWVTVCGPYHALCDADLLGDSLTAGPRTPGDRMQPLGLGATKKLQDLFVDRGVPSLSRDKVAVVRNARHVVWVPGLTLDARVALRPSTNRVAHLIFRREA